MYSSASIPPGQNWSESRAKGIMNGLEEFKKANPNRQIVIDRLDVSPEGAVVATASAPISAPIRT